MSSAYYNEIDPRAAEWIRELALGGHVAPGDVDERSVSDLWPEDVAGDGQRHFFAGIGGWSYALRLAGWPDDVPVWTGSCPCQPFSAAGRGRGFDDERHLWPTWFRLIRECRPTVIFGEQVASPAGLAWLDLVQADLEGAGYAVGAADLCAASIGAPHIRQRLYWVAYSSSEGLEIIREQQARQQRATVERGGSVSALADDKCGGSGTGRSSETSGRSSIEPDRRGATRGLWAGADWLECRDGKARPVEPGSFPLAHGIPGRVGLLRGYGNAIVPEVAAAFIRSAHDAIFTVAESKNS